MSSVIRKGTRNRLNSVKKAKSGKGIVQILKNDQGSWCIADIDKKVTNDKYTYNTQSEAIKKASVEYPKAIVVVKGTNGDIRKVTGVKPFSNGKRISSKSKLNSKDIDIAIAKAIIE